MAIESGSASSGVEADPIAVLIHAGRHREAISECVRHHGAPVGRMCMALLGDQAEAEETLQEAMLAAYQSMATWRAEGSVRAWLYGIARRMCARRLAKRVRRERRLRLVHDAGTTAALPDAVVETRRRAAALREALEELKPSDREALLLRYESGLSFREIAAVCGIDEPAARKRASRALVRLRTLLPQSEL